MNEFLLSLTYVFRETLSLIRQNFNQLVLRVGLLVVVYVVLSYLYEITAGIRWRPFYEAISMVLGGVIWILIAIRTHRILILPAKKLSGAEKTETDMEAFVRFALRTFWLCILTSLCFVPLFFALIVAMDDLSFGWLYYLVAGFCIALSMICFAYTSRFWLVLPSIAVGLPMRFRDALLLTRNYKLLMVTVTVIPIMLALLPWYFMESVLDLGIISSISYALYMMVLTVIEIGILSAAYIYILEKTPPKI